MRLKEVAKPFLQRRISHQEFSCSTKDMLTDIQRNNLYRGIHQAHILISHKSIGKSIDMPGNPVRTVN